MIEVSVYGVDNYMWGSRGKRTVSKTPRVVMTGTEFRFFIEQGFPGSDVTAPDPDQGYLTCTAGPHAGRQTFIDASDEIVFRSVSDDSAAVKPAREG